MSFDPFDKAQDRPTARQSLTGTDSNSSPRMWESTADESGVRLDKYLSDNAGIPRARAHQLILDGLATVNGKGAKASQKTVAGDRITAVLLPPKPPSLEPESIPMPVVYQDEDVLVVDKPAGLTVHPAPGHPDHTLVNAVLALRPELKDEDGSMRPGIVHRLDKDTSGLMVVTLNSVAQANLAEQIREHAWTRKYLALVEGTLTPGRGVIDAPIGRDPRNRQRMAVVTRGRDARTGYRVLEYHHGYTFIEVAPETGRTHQIRVHMAAIEHPVAGDHVYNRHAAAEAADLGLQRQFLHSHVLGFNHPRDGQYVEFTSPLPPDLQEPLEALRSQGSITHNSRNTL